MRFIFRSEQIVEAKNEKEAWEKFANDSIDFSANATCCDLDQDEWNRDYIRHGRAE